MDHTVTRVAAVKATALAPVRVEAAADVASPPGEPMVDFIRKIVRHLVNSGEPETIRMALALLAKHAQDAAAASPVTQDLTAWQLLAVDLAAALEPLDVECSLAAAALATDLHSTIAMIARNPAAELAVRPSSRRVLEALADLGGVATAAAVRTRTGHSPSHFSNILTALTAHGFVRKEQAAGDRRRIDLQLTDIAKDAMIRSKTDTPRADKYEELIRSDSPAAGDAYPETLKLVRDKVH